MKSHNRLAMNVLRNNRPLDTRNELTRIKEYVSQWKHAYVCIKTIKQTTHIWYVQKFIKKSFFLVITKNVIFTRKITK